MNWKEQLTKKELQHLKDVFEGQRITLDNLKRNFEGQALMRRDENSIEPCWTCKGIAKKLGFSV
ncbi:MAG: hypothetical protein AVO38_10965 [delta proteobacterium ML8_D]|nr:MAG: hypothetical protein AVO34_05360 [Firmicutes bacterium ML8_F2]OPL15107.1 MAG: hypothetical protein AVO38_10965 [delta proteobacterium ML8_D]